MVGGYAAELDELLRVIRSSTAHFVRCIKPNVRKAARCFEEPVVMRQLRCGGVLEAVRVFASGFPDRMPIRDFVGTYCSVVAPSKLPPHPPGGPPSQGDAPTAWERGACAAILRAFDVADEATALGHTKVFLGAGVAAHCKAKREARLAGLIAVVQAAARGLLARRSLRRRAALREKEEERERQIAALQAQQEAERAATRGAVGLRRKASFEREASVKRRQQQERAAAAKRTEEATASWAAREAELTKLHTELTRQAGRKQAALAAELAQLTAALRKAEERNAALERAQAEERAAAAAREVELQTAVSHWRDEAALAAQREQQASEMGEARLAQAVEREGEARDEASFFRARFQELALSFARAQDPAPPRSRPPNADGGGFFGAVASLIGGGAKPRPSRGRGRTSLSASRPAGDAPSSPAEKARAPPQAPLFSPRTMSIAEEPYSPPQPPAPRDAPTPADATALASYLGLHPVRDAKLMWIAEAAAAEPLPEGWSKVVDPGGRLYYSNGVTGESSRVHPRDEEFRLLVMRSKLEQMHSAPAAQPSAGDWSTIRMKSLEQSLSSAASAPVRALVQRSGDRRGGAPRLTFEMLLDEDTRLPWMEAVLREGPRGAAFELLLEGGAAEKSEHLVRLSGPSSSVLVRRERRDAPLPEDGPVGEEVELAAVIFVEVLGEADESGARGGEEAPYSMELVVPAAKRGGATQAHKPRGPSDTLLQRYGRGETEGLLVFVGQVARSAAAEAPSAAVRLSLPKTDSGNLLLQTSGRRGANRATLEYRDPLSPLAAFSAALALVHWSERAQSALARAAIGKGRLSVG